MNSDKLKITFLLIAVLAICTFFISVGNEMDIARLEAGNDSLRVEIRQDLDEIRRIMDGVNDHPDNK